MVRIISVFVETLFYVVAVALVIFVATFLFALKHDKTRLLRISGSKGVGNASEQPCFRTVQPIVNDVCFVVTVLQKSSIS